MRSNSSRFLVAKGVHLYLTNECSKTQIEDIISPPHLGDGYGVFSNMKHLYFTEEELVGADKVITIFRLNEEDWSVARYVVVDTDEVCVIQDNETVGIKYQLVAKRFYDDKLSI
jgi:hypothetical protein